MAHHSRCNWTTALKYHSARTAEPNALRLWMCSLAFTMNLCSFFYVNDYNLKLRFPVKKHARVFYQGPPVCLMTDTKQHLGLMVHFKLLLCSVFSTISSGDVFLPCKEMNSLWVLWPCCCHCGKGATLRWIAGNMYRHVSFEYISN